MTVPTWTPEFDPLLDEALDWVIRLKTGAPLRSDLDALRHWREQSAAHDEAFKTAARLFRQAGVAARELAHEQEDQRATRAPRGASSPQLPSRSVTRRLVLSGSIAAAAAYMVVHPPFGLWPSISEFSADYRTTKGEHRKVMLTPDIALELSTQTSVALRPAPDQLRIELIAGEASVTARLASQKPVELVAAGGRVSASQADFNARCLDGVVAVTCLDGSVAVAQDGRVVQLRASEQVSYSAAGLQAVIPVDTAQVSAWRTGLLIFRDRPLASVVEEVNRYRSGKIIITNDDLKRRLVNGTFQLDRLDNFVAQVEQLFGARAVSLPAGVVLLS
ncbi:MULTISPECIES: FecR family protein [unclassified Bradyrhizobium]|uniref:FecR family protein n=1 Tax=unclassified Bradyrhizobium TaxID=2631580 RepID=UPI0028ED5CA5|nr:MULTISPECIES: FecR domain-containing protein [unclassified Bradyrhizobium]